VSVNTSAGRRSSRAAWALLPLIVAVLGAGSAKVWWPTQSQQSAPNIKVLGQKFTASGSNTANNGCGVGNGGSSKPECNPNAGHQLTVTGQVLGSLMPGGRTTLQVSVKNENNQAVQLTAVDATVGTPTITGTPVHDGCLSSWFAVDDFAGSQTISKYGTGIVNLALRMTNEPTTNQDDCKSADIPLTFTATVTG
jgi:hypothetical protein